MAGWGKQVQVAWAGQAWNPIGGVAMLTRSWAGNKKATKGMWVGAKGGGRYGQGRQGGAGAGGRKVWEGWARKAQQVICHALWARVWGNLVQGPNRVGRLAQESQGWGSGEEGGMYSMAWEGIP